MGTHTRRWVFAGASILVAGLLTWHYLNRTGGSVGTDLTAPSIVTVLTFGLAVFLYYQEQHDSDQRVRDALLIELKQTHDGLVKPAKKPFTMILPDGTKIEQRLHLLPIYGMARAAERPVLEDDLMAKLLHLLGDIDVYNRRVELLMDHVVGQTVIQQGHYDLWRANLQEFYIGPVAKLRDSIVEQLKELIDAIEA